MADAGIGMEGATAGRELDLQLRRLSGAHAHRAVHTGVMELAAHRHDWPCLAFHLLGRYRELNEAGETTIEGPAVALHGAGEVHAERFGPSGAEALILEFDPDWLGAGWARRLKRTRVWPGAGVAAHGRSLAALWLDPATDEQKLKRATSAFLEGALAAEAPPPAPSWLPEVKAWVHAPSNARTPDIARSLGLHPAWLARAYRASVGEGLRDTLRRARAERAIALLRQTGLPLAEVALEAGFCDQSHLNRTLHALAGRTPAEVREEGRSTPLQGCGASAGSAP